MKKIIAGFGIAVACFAGVFVALRADHVMSQNQTIHDVLASPVMPVDFEQGAGVVDFRAAVKKVMPTVVSVDKYEHVFGFFEDQGVRQTSTGSGVIISKDGYILTNNHVVANSEFVKVRLSDKRTLDAKVLGTDPRADLALLKVEADNLVAAELADSSKVEIGEWVIACGNPLGFSNTVSAGVVSSLGRTLPVQGTVLVDSIQTDASINSGNSGGALANIKGQIVGINSAIASNSGGSVGLGFAIPINRAKSVVADILKYGHVRYGDLGVSLLSERSVSDPQVRQYFKQNFGIMPPTTGVLVRDVFRNSPAAGLDIKRTSILISIDGQNLDDYTDFVKVMSDKKPGDQIQLKYWTEGKTLSAKVTLKDISSI